MVAIPARGAEKPNILFIAIDDQNDWFGCLGGHPQAKTPNIDGLAERGTLLTNAHCQSPLCNPCRTSLMTGLRPSTTGIYGLAPWFRDVPKWKNVVTLPQYLARNGYRTYSTGKIYHGGYGRRKTDHEFDVLGPPAAVGARPKEKLVDTPSKHPLVDWGVFPHEDEDKGDWKVATWAVERLDSELPEPRLKFLQEAHQWKNLVRSYLACTGFVDSQVGRLLEALQRSGHDDDTIIVLWSDHGWHLGEKLITGKNTLWDRSTHVPLIFAGPGVAVGARCNRPAELLDIYPTLVELCGLPPKQGLEGHSLVPQLKDADAVRPWPAITTHNHDNHGVRTENWRFIQYADGSEELYDMRADPNEWTNLVGDPAYREVVERHRRLLPPHSAKPVAGSASRILIYENGKANWEGEDILADDPIPEL